MFSAIKRRREAKCSFDYGSMIISPAKQQMRLFRLFPGAASDRIIGELFVVSFVDRDSPKYDALSYCWGSPSATFTITVNGGKLLQIAHNLHHALQDIRQPDRSIVIFVDAICIDQNNKDEVSNQVQLMRNIYAGSQLVRVWIDHEIDTRCEVFTSLPEVDIHSFDNLRIGDEKFWSPAVSLLRNAYWRRLWVQQELILAQHIAVHCRSTVLGQKLTQWLLKFPGEVNRIRRGTGNSKVRTLDQLVNPELLPPFFGGVEYGRTVIERITVWHLSRHLYSRDFTWGSLLQLFIETSGLEMSNPRDRVYGLLGIAIDFEMGDIAVDYTLPVPQVYGQITEMYLKKHRSLVFLCHSGGEDQDQPDKLPSWLPAPASRCEILWAPIERTVESGWTGIAHGAYLHTNHRALSVRGVMIDSVFKVRMGGVSDTSLLSELNTELEDHYNCKKSFAKWDSAEAIDELTTVLFPWWTDSRYDAYNFAKLTPAEKRSAVRKLLHMAKIYPEWSFSHLLVSGSFDPSDVATVQECKAFEMIYYLLQGAQLLSTSGGRLGLVSIHSQLQKGDEIWALYGCPLPIVLRPRREFLDGYIWVGCVENLAGSMQGQGLATLPETILLRGMHQEPEARQIDIW